MSAQNSSPALSYPVLWSVWALDESKGGFYRVEEVGLCSQWQQPQAGLQITSAHTRVQLLGKKRKKRKKKKKKKKSRTELNLLICSTASICKQYKADSMRWPALALLNLSPCSSPWPCSCHRLYRASGGRTPASDTSPWWTRPCWGFKETRTKWRWLWRCSFNKGKWRKVYSQNLQPSVWFWVIWMPKKAIFQAFFSGQCLTSLFAWCVINSWDSINSFSVPPFLSIYHKVCTRTSLKTLSFKWPTLEILTKSNQTFKTQHRSSSQQPQTQSGLIAWPSFSLDTGHELVPLRNLLYPLNGSASKLLPQAICSQSTLHFFHAVNMALEDIASKMNKCRSTRTQVGGL